MASLIQGRKSYKKLGFQGCFSESIISNSKLDYKCGDAATERFRDFVCRLKRVRRGLVDGTEREGIRWNDD